MRAARTLLLAACLTAGCGGDEEPGEIPVPAPLDREAIPRDAYVKPLGAALLETPARDDPAYLRAFVTTFTSMTPENALKWEEVQPERGKFDFRTADALVGLARRTGKRVRGHTLVWDRQLPTWIDDAGGGPRELAAILREHVRTVVRRYRGRISEWDVVNEPLEGDGSWTRSIWYRTLGERYVDIAFRAARHADPRARLFLNEVDAERRGPKGRALRRLARRLQRRGVPIDGVGFQNHTIIAARRRRAALTRTLGSYARLGLRTAITEMDVTIPPWYPPRKGLRLQARAYRDAALACRAVASCTGLTVWGVNDAYSWKGSDVRALPIDGAGRPKAALETLREALAR